MNTQDWRRLNELAERLEAAWEKADDVDLGTLLPPNGDPLRASVLQELITTDLEIRWRRKQGRPLEFYVTLYPELGSTVALPPKLIYEEYRVRYRHGDQPDLKLYQDRFPEQYSHLRKLLEQDPIVTLGSNYSTPVAPRNQQQSQENKPTILWPNGAGAIAPKAASSQSMDNKQVLPISGYTLDKLIGRGGFGEVYRATAPGGFPAAVKIITRPADHEERLREARSLEVIKQLNHHFLIKTLASWSEEDRLFIVMDLADSSLRERLKQCKAAKQKGIPVEELLRYFREGAEALDYLHEQDVLHRDIKPDNILLVGNHVRLADFGLARHQQQILASVSGSGTPAYMPPEVYRGKVSKFSDQYSFAYTYAELRLGHRAFASTDYAGVMFDHLDNTPSLDPLPAPEQKVILKALAKKPDDRYPSCLAFVEALEDALGIVPRGSRQVPSLARHPANPTMQKQRELSPTLSGNSLSVSRIADANLSTPGAEQFKSLVKDEYDSVHSVTAPVPSARPKRRRRGVWSLIAGLLGIVALGAIAGLVVPRLLHLGQTVPTVPGPGSGPNNVPEPPPVAKAWLPEHYKAAVDSPIVTDAQKQTYYQRIVSDLPGVPETTFVLIPQESANDLPSYYLMETKVWNALAAALARKAGILDRWSAAAAELPAFGMSAEEADKMASVLAGRRPTKEQWDKAAGFEPTKPPATVIGGKQPAVNRRVQGPRSVTEKLDVSVFGILDMGGNGTELTHDRPKDAQDDLVILRGQRHTAPKPLQYADLVEQQTTPQVQFYNAHSPFTGFRVVIEPPPTEAKR